MNKYLSYTLRIGKESSFFILHTAKLFWFMVRVIAASLRGPFYKDQLLKQLYEMGFRAIPLVSLTAIFTGMVLAYQSYTSFSRFSAEIVLPEIVALSLIRELGPVLSALMMAGRWGASIAAELATMRVTDQLDALTSLSIHPLRYLVTPRWITALIALPLLTFLSDIIGMIGGYLVGVYHCHIHGPTYLAKTWEAVTFHDFFSGFVKAFFFGAIIALVGAYEGYHATQGAQGVGKATTQGVVRSCVLILFANYFLTAFLFSR